mmetsp:Transcript_6415/g.4839  ORF Transcript_6415/g.4839 Transcript_6415/m.4839 type:complete len:98 (-) Transcript_6415:411-704(-)|eukprot:CAMPEP_0202969486 /NCGR_PEP_ID=MMETSP1396-20130829/15234_1 /ASSEMBLY_ACC=CAM_ASM_000872 /TAXON_ID= /ORGANISM="Pseudokeronopsis sp., Strain Brazil" /LENGTH=97 /DNA_ID=CAMNT_0049697085 /DNA_START=52 /DNA_END=345 /DNA_ORIENTATION=+
MTEANYDQDDFKEEFDDCIDPNMILPDKWTMWEQYERFEQVKKGQTLQEYEANIKKFGCFNNAVSFWQIWNNSYISDLKNIFYKKETNSVPSYEIKG